VSFKNPGRFAIVKLLRATLAEFWHCHCHSCSQLLAGESGHVYTERIWSHATEQKWYESPYTGIYNKRFYVASGVWDVCPKSKQPYTKWG